MPPLSQRPHPHETERAGGKDSFEAWEGENPADPDFFNDAQRFQQELLCIKKIQDKNNSREETTPSPQVTIFKVQQTRRVRRVHET
jgi:hypothetical protein